MVTYKVTRKIHPSNHYLLTICNKTRISHIIIDRLRLRFSFPSQRQHHQICFPIRIIEKPRKIYLMKSRIQKRIQKAKIVDVKTRKSPMKCLKSGLETSLANTWWCTWITYNRSDLELGQMGEVIFCHFHQVVQ